MLVGGMEPVAEPWLQWSKHRRRCARVLRERLPFRLCRTAVLVEDLGRHGQLADVVEQGSPTELTEILVAQADLFTEHLGVGPDAFGVATGQPIVVVEFLEELDEVVAVERSTVAVAASTRRLHLTQHSPRVRFPQRGLGSRWCLIRENEGQLHQGDERNQPSTQLRDHEQEHIRADEDQGDPQPPIHVQLRGREVLAGREGEGDRRGDRRDDDADPEESRQLRMRRPPFNCSGMPLRPLCGARCAHLKGVSARILPN